MKSDCLLKQKDTRVVVNECSKLFPSFLCSCYSSHGRTYRLQNTHSSSAALRPPQTNHARTNIILKPNSDNFDLNCSHAWSWILSSTIVCPFQKSESAETMNLCPVLRACYRMSNKINELQNYVYGSRVRLRRRCRYSSLMSLINLIIRRRLVWAGTEFQRFIRSAFWLPLHVLWELELPTKSAIMDNCYTATSHTRIQLQMILLAQIPSLDEMKNK